VFLDCPLFSTAPKIAHPSQLHQQKELLLKKDLNLEAEKNYD
jgi:hypothetical protein